MVLYRTQPRLTSQLPLDIVWTWPWLSWSSLRPCIPARFIKMLTTWRVLYSTELYLLSVPVGWWNPWGVGNKDSHPFCIYPWPMTLRYEALWLTFPFIPLDPLIALLPNPLEALAKPSEFLTPFKPGTCEGCSNVWTGYTLPMLVARVRVLERCTASVMDKLVSTYTRSSTPVKRHVKCC